MATAYKAARDVAEQYKNEARGYYEHDPALAAVKEEIAQAFDYFADLLRTQS